MKLPKFLRPAPAEPSPLESSSVTISSDVFAVAPYRDGEPSGERRRVILTAPAGISALPVTGAEVLSASVAGDTLLLGCPDGEKAQKITLTVGVSSIEITERAIVLRCGGTVLSVTPEGVFY